MRETDDTALVERFKNGDESAFEELVRAYQDRIYTLCRHMLGDIHDAEDAAQDSFLKAYQHLKSFVPEASLYTWLYRIAVNTCIDYRRKPFWESLFKRFAEGEEYLAEPPSGAPSPDRLYESKQMGDLLRQSLARLSPKLRSSIVLKEVEGLSYEEIAEVLDISMGTVKSRIARARDELKKMMKKYTEQK